MGQKDENEKLVHGWLFKIAEKIADSFVERLPAFSQKAWKGFEDNVPKQSQTNWEKWCNDLVKQGYCDQDTADLMKPVRGWSFPFGAIMTFMIQFKSLFTDIDAILNIYSLDRQYDSLAKTTPNPAPVDNLVRSMIIDPARSKENRTELKKHGYSDTQIDNIILSYYRTTDENTVRMLFLRGIITETKMYERMRELGYTDTRTAEIIQTWKLLPSPGDLFTMVAREAFEPEMYTKLGLSAEFPTEQIKWLEEQGISKAWAEKYWIAHWEQPSIGQGFEMLHRGVIDRDTLDLLFRAVEIPSFWREKLTQIAYMPFTRVDVRRMHELGVITDEELIKSYMDLGYDSEKALKLAEFTIKYNAETEKQLTRSTILESYSEDLISRTDASTLLQSQGYSYDLADYYLTLEDYNRDKEVQSIYFDVIEDQYLTGLITETTARSSLNKLGIRGNKIDALIDQWNVYKYRYDAIPSKSDLDRLLVKQIIDQGTYRAFMKQHGFSEMIIDMYIEDMKSELEAGERLPSKADLESWYKGKLIDEKRYIYEMKLQGYSDDYVQLYMKELNPKYNY